MITTRDLLSFSLQKWNIIYSLLPTYHYWLIGFVKFFNLNFIFLNYQTIFILVGINHWLTFFFLISINILNIIKRNIWFLYDFWLLNGSNDFCKNFKSILISISCSGIFHLSICNAIIILFYRETTFYTIYNLYLHFSRHFYYNTFHLFTTRYPFRGVYVVCYTNINYCTGGTLNPCKIVRFW